MMLWNPKVGDPCVSVRRRSNDEPLLGTMTTVHRVTATMVITADGERYNRIELHPVKGGRYSPLRLHPLHDPEVVAIRARAKLREIAQVADNIARLNHRTGEDVVSALARVIAAADGARNEVIEMMREATKGGEPA